MSIECYFSSCPHHSIHYGDEGPYCDELKCIAPKDKLEQYGRERLQLLAKMSSSPPEDEVVEQFDSDHAHDMYSSSPGAADPFVDAAAKTDTPPAVLYAYSKVVEFFSKPNFKEFVGGRRIGQAFYDFMGFKPDQQSVNVNHKLDKIYEADGAEAKALIESYADFNG